MLIKDLTAVRGLPFTQVRMQERLATYLLLQTHNGVISVVTCSHAEPPFQGSLTYKDHTAQQNDPLVAVLLQSGAIILWQNQHTSIWGRNQRIQ